MKVEQSRFTVEPAPAKPQMSLEMSKEGGRAGWPFEMLLVIALGLLACSVAISNQSFWMDEVVIAYKARLPTLHQWWQTISQGGSDLEQPLYPFFTWFWQRLVNHTEFALRAGNALWFVLALAIAFRALAARSSLRWAFVAALVCSPFAWYYLNEARPYTVQLACSVAVLSAIAWLGCNERTVEGEHRWIAVLCTASVLLAASGMIAMLWLGAYLGAALASTSVSRLCSTFYRNRWILAATLLVLFGMGLFYLWTLKIGARATEVGTTDWRNVLFILFELLGFAGLGPGREAIRSEGLKAFNSFMPYLAAYGLVLTVVFLSGLRALAARHPKKTLLLWCLAFGLVALFVLAVGYTVRFRALGRHFTPALPVLLAVVGAGLAELRKGKLAHKLAALSFITLSLISCTMVRFADRHAKEDYRAAAGVARTALDQGKVVWWNAYDLGAELYGVQVKPVTQSGTALLLFNPHSDFQVGLAKPDLVVTSRPDVNDCSGVLQRFLQVNYESSSALHAFRIWRPKGELVAPAP